LIVGEEHNVEKDPAAGVGEGEAVRAPGDQERKPKAVADIKGEGKATKEGCFAKAVHFARGK
jgi:hypothetical protein